MVILMPIINFPYGQKTLQHTIPEHRLKGELISELHSYVPEHAQEELVRIALANPVGTPTLSAMAEGKEDIVIIASDHTRPVPSKIIIPLMLEQLRKGSPRASITILVSTGCHRASTQDELIAKFGSDIYENETIIVHDCDSPDMVNLGKMPSGGEIIINRLAVKADLLVSEGFIEPHFFAGFSGGRKSLMPGIASRKTVLFNHNAEFIAHPHARTGIIDGNPIHIDMLYACRVARLAFICNVIINSKKEVIYAIAGDCDLAHAAGRSFLLNRCAVKKIPADIVIVTNGGYPLDQNIYQAVKGMTAAEATVKKGGVIIMLAESVDGHGAPEFYKTFSEEKNLDRMLNTFLNTPKEKTRVDQWQSQIFARVLQHARVIYISNVQDSIISDMHMTPAHSIAEAIEIAEEMLNNPKASIVAIPDGVSVVVV